ncbi:MAG: hypothetical protein IKP36_05150 [Bacteroidaceae bacterium]|nr:hypothetical protein [Bacteroidaceae bacterium]
MDVCDFKLAQDIAGSCTNPQVAGLKNTGYLINYDDIDWDALAKANDNPNIVETLLLLSGKRAYKVVVPGNTPFTGTQAALATGTYRNKFTKTASIVVLDSGPDVSKNVIDQLANGRFVFIFENKYQGADKKNTFEIYGLEQGLAATEMTNEKYSEETDGGWAVTLEETGAPTSGLFLFKTSIATTRAALESLVTGSQGNS